MTTHTISVGNVEITALSDGYIRFAPGGFFPSVPAERWEEYRGELTAEGKLELNVGSFLVRSEGRVILVDTGIGEDASGFDDAHSGLLPQALADLGVSATDVDVVLMTHLHVDHVGWNVATAEDGPAPVFPNARYHVAAADWRAFARMARMNGAPYLQPRCCRWRSWACWSCSRARSLSRPRWSPCPRRATPRGTRRCGYRRRGRRPS